MIDTHLVYRLITPSYYSSLYEVVAIEGSNIPVFPKIGQQDSIHSILNAIVNGCAVTFLPYDEQYDPNKHLKNFGR